MEAKTLKGVALVVVTTVGVSPAAWEKVPLPASVNESLAWMHFVSPTLGFAAVRDTLTPDNFLVYENGYWHVRPTYIPGGYWGYYSFLPSGVGWVAADQHYLWLCLHTSRHHGGNNWEGMNNPYSQPPGYTNNGRPGPMACAAIDDYWHVFYDNYGNLDRILRYKDGGWKEERYNLPRELGHLYGLYFISPDDGWASGSGGLARYKNGLWEFLGGTPIVSMDFTAADDGWGLGAGNVWHYNGVSWSPVFSVPGFSTLALSFCDRDNGWVAFYNAREDFLLYRYYRGIWQRVTAPESAWLPFSCAGPNDAWFYGQEYIPGQGWKMFTWHWYTEEKIEGASLGQIKARFK